MIRSAALVIVLAACAHPKAAVTHREPVPATVVFSDRIALQSGDSLRPLVLLVRDRDAPELLLPYSTIAIRHPGEDRQSPCVRQALSGADGVAHLMRPGTGDFIVLVRRVGYEPLEFTVRLRPLCAQTLEIYISQAVTVVEDTGRGQLWSGVVVDGELAGSTPLPPTEPSVDFLQEPPHLL